MEKDEMFSALEEFVPHWEQHLSKMATEGEFGDHLTQQGVAHKFDIQIIVLSSLGDLYNRFISKRSYDSGLYSADKPTILLGHYAEDDGAHYVCLKTTGRPTMKQLISTRLLQISLHQTTSSYLTPSQTETNRQNMKGKYSYKHAFHLNIKDNEVKLHVM
jgi:hypothetical protein